MSKNGSHRSALASAASQGLRRSSPPSSPSSPDGARAQIPRSALSSNQTSSGPVFFRLGRATHCRPEAAVLRCAAAVPLDGACEPCVLSGCAAFCVGRTCILPAVRASSRRCNARGCALNAGSARPPSTLRVMRLNLDAVLPSSDDTSHYWKHLVRTRACFL